MEKDIYKVKPYSEDSKKSDVMNAYNIGIETKNENLNYVVSTESEIKDMGIKNVLEKSVSVFTNYGKALVIYGDQLPQTYVINAFKTSSIITKMGIQNIVISSSDISSDNLSEVIKNKDFTNKNKPAANCNKDSDCKAGAMPYSSCKGNTSCTEAAIYTCLNPGTINSVCQYNGTCVPCPNGCKDGVCIQLSSNQTQGNSKNLSSGEDKDICNGCRLDNKCYPYNNRKTGEYCSMDKTWIKYKSSSETCENNFECDSNLCINNKCVSGSMWQKIIDWFSHLFGGK